jgi:hypothetical protein
LAESVDILDVQRYFEGLSALIGQVEGHALAKVVVGGALGVEKRKAEEEGGKPHSHHLMVDRPELMVLRALHV